MITLDRPHYLFYIWNISLILNVHLDILKGTWVGNQLYVEYNTCSPFKIREMIGEIKLSPFIQEFMPRLLLPDYALQI